jgi:hypothetical protein
MGGTGTGKVNYIGSNVYSVTIINDLDGVEDHRNTKGGILSCCRAIDRFT